MDETIECSTHGQGVPYGFVCKHLQAGEGTGWHDADSDELCPDAWCDDCERLRLAAGGWTDEAGEAAGITVACAYCYHRLRGSRLVVPPLDASTPNALVHSARVEMQRRNDALVDIYAAGRWWYDLDEARIEFRRGGRTVARARIASLGSYSEGSGTWLSAWMNGYVPARAGARSAAVAAYASRLGFEDLAEAHVACSLEEAWGRAAVAAAVLGAVGLYRCPSDGLHSFLALLDVERIGTEDRSRRAPDRAVVLAGVLKRD